MDTISAARFTAQAQAMIPSSQQQCNDLDTQMNSALLPLRSALFITWYQT